MKFIITQIVGAIAYSLLAFSYYKKNKKEILFMQIFAYIGFIIHYYLLDAKTGAVCNALGFVALILLYFYSDNQKKKKILVLVLIPILAIMSYFSYQNVYSFLPVIACLITFLSFLSKKENLIRLVGIISALLWMIYAIVLKSYVAIVFEVLTVLITSIAYYKNKKNR